jgi:hypothetical protein
MRSVPRLYTESCELLVQSELEQRVEKITRSHMWFEDFMCALVQWYLECDSYSSCVQKIRCQETVIEIFAEE